MKFSISSLTWILALCISLSFTACTPAKKVQKYSYLLKNKSHPKLVKTATSSSKPRITSARPKTKATAIGGTSAAAVPSREIKTIIKTAESFIGTPYKYGGLSRKGVDCSGLVYTSFKAVDKQIPRTSSAQSKAGIPVSKKQIKPGHIIFFSAKNTSRIDHVGLVTDVKGKEIKFVHATTSRGVRTDSLTDTYWGRRFRKAVAF